MKVSVIKNGQGDIVVSGVVREIYIRVVVSEYMTTNHDSGMSQVHNFDGVGYHLATHFA